MKLEKWVKAFYKKQFEMSSSLFEYSEQYHEFAEEIISQVGKPFHTVLEIGAGSRNLARAIASNKKDVTTVELVPELVEHAKKSNSQNITSLCGNFYDVELPQSYDVLLYIDGFGVGNDQDQLFLLKRIQGWLKDDGVGLIDIYNPAYWKIADGQQMYIDSESRVLPKYGYDDVEKRMTDTWWYEDKPRDTYTQSLACYELNEIETMCKEAGLKIVDVFPGGAMDWEAGYISHEILNERQSTWTFQSDLGFMKKDVTLQIDIKEWNEPNEVIFDLKGLSDNFGGSGYFLAEKLDENRS